MANNPKKLQYFKQQTKTKKCQSMTQKVNLHAKWAAVEKTLIYLLKKYQISLIK